MELILALLLVPLAIIVGLAIQAVFLRVSFVVAAKLGLGPLRQDFGRETFGEASIDDAPLADTLIRGEDDGVRPLNEIPFKECFKTAGLIAVVNFFVGILLNIAMYALAQANANGLASVLALVSLVANFAVFAWALNKRHGISYGTAFLILLIQILLGLVLAALVFGIIVAVARLA